MTDSMRDLEWYNPIRPEIVAAQDKAIQARQMARNDKRVADHWRKQNEPVRKPSGLFRDVETGEYYQTSQPYEPGTLKVTKKKPHGKKRVVKITELEDCK